MKGYVSIQQERLGEVEFKIIDLSMGCIGGLLSSYPAYTIVKDKIQAICELKGIANIDDFDFEVCFENNIAIEAQGGMGITDIADSDEIYVECGGVDQKILQLFAI